MIRRALHQYTPGTIRARTRGVQAIMLGRHDLLKPSPMKNATRGYGVVQIIRTGEMSYPGLTRVTRRNAKRTMLRISNDSHKLSNGDNDSQWAYINSKWQSPPYTTQRTAVLGFSFGEMGTGRMQTIEIGEARIFDGRIDGTLNLVGVMYPLGTPVRWMIEETINYGIW